MYIYQIWETRQKYVCVRLVLLNSSFMEPTKIKAHFLSFLAGQKKGGIFRHRSMFAGSTSPEKMAHFCALSPTRLIAGYDGRSLAFLRLSCKPSSPRRVHLGFNSLKSRLPGKMASFGPSLCRMSSSGTLSFWTLFVCIAYLLC